jgi:uncharacterized Fe-S center protein
MKKFRLILSVALLALASCAFADVPKVYMTKNITPAGLVAVYRAMNWKPVGKVGVKLSTGEPPASNYLRPALVKDVVQLVNGTIVECNTAYGGARSNAESHMKVAEEHGFTAIAPVDIQDAKGETVLPVKGGQRLKENYVGASFNDYGSYLVLSHFKGHAMAGYGGAIKNISIGMASSSGKLWIHTGGISRSSWGGGTHDAFLEAMADAAKAVSDARAGRMAYINVMNRLSVDCDCDGTPDEPDMHDIGVLASTDPVALDQACLDLVWKAPDSAKLKERVTSRNGFHTLEAADKVGLGSRKYELVVID